ncbi:MAG: M48 family metallopeptidase [Nitrospira sp.]|nr:M48 family metallopeptidase [Nitrospira sp.]
MGSLQERWLADEMKVVEIVWPLLVAATEFCPLETEPTYGFLLDSARRDAEEGHSNGETPVVRYVHPLLPAGQAGLRSGSKLLALNGEDATQWTPSEVMRRASVAALARIQPLMVRVSLRGRIEEVPITAVSSCRYRLVVIQDEAVNAFADGKAIAVTRGLLRMVRSDAELALVIAHEIAHNALAHSQTAQLDQALRAVLSAHVVKGVDVGPPKSRHEFELAADRIGLYIVARAGYEPQRAIDFWRRMALLPSHADDAYGRDHPSTEERLESLEQAAEVLAVKQVKGDPLRP